MTTRTLRGLKAEASHRSRRLGHVLRRWPATDDGRFTTTTCRGCSCTVVLDVADNPPTAGAPLRFRCDQLAHIHHQEATA